MITPSYKLIDSHAHLTMAHYKDDLEHVIERARMCGIDHIVNIIMGPDEKIVEDSLKECESWPNVSAALGIHPHDAHLATKDALTYIAQKARHPKVNIIGEIGLDYFYEHSPRKQQQDCFKELIQVAMAQKKPISIHTRDAFEDTRAILRESHFFEKHNAVIHCFTGTQKEATGFLDMGAYISFSGIISFKKSEDLRKIVAYVPLDRLMIETDAPFLTPEPYRGKRNEPAYVVRVAETIAAIKGISIEELAHATRANTITAFGLTI